MKKDEVLEYARKAKEAGSTRFCMGAAWREVRDNRDFDRVIDMKYFFEFDNSLLLSAVKNGHTDIFTYSISNGKTEQITNDVYDDLDPSFVAFPGKSGIIYSSNRPSPKARSADTVLPHNNYNIYLIDNWNKSSEKQISKLTDLKYGNAVCRYNTTPPTSPS